MTFTLVATVKDEGPYLWEWVAYHRMIGFDHIIIFQNDSTDFTHEILSEMQAHGLVVYRYNRAARGRHQVRAYIRASRQPEYLAADYVMALDLDEFLVIHTGNGGLNDLVAAMPDFDSAHINWLKFGSGGITEMPEGLVTQTFIKCESAARVITEVEAFKTLFRRAAYARPGIHKPLEKEDPSPPQLMIVNGSGCSEDQFTLKNFQCSDPDNRRLAQVNHYIVKDAAGFVLKSAKGSAHQANRKIDQKYWQSRNKNSSEDLRLASRNEDIRDMMREIDNKTGGKLSDLTRKSRAHHQEAFEKALSEPWAADLYRFCCGTAEVAKQR
jgi:hypothetical protein